MHATPNNQNTQNAQGSQNTAVKDIPAARAENMSKIYGAGDTKVVALDNVTVEFAPGEFTAIMGPSGSGKSTLMHCMAGLDTPTNGAAYLGTTDISQLGDKALTKLRRDRLGFIFQSFNLVPTLTAAENITLPIDVAGDKVDKDWFAEMTDRLGLTDRLGHRPSNSPAASNSAWHAPAPWWRDRRSSSATSRPATWTPTPRPRCWPSCAPPSTVTTRPSSSSPTTPGPPPTPTG